MASSVNWDELEDRDTIQRFAEEIVGTPPNLSKEEKLDRIVRATNRIVRAIWLGEFETSGRDGGCAISLPAVCADGPIDDPVWKDEAGEETTRPYPAFGREDLRNALQGNDPNAKRQLKLKKFEVLAEKPITRLVKLSSTPANFQSAYLDDLLIEKAAVRQWYEMHFPATTEAKEASPQVPAVQVDSAETPDGVDEPQSEPTHTQFVPHIGAETKCQAWLEGMMRESPKFGHDVKAAIFAEARSKFSGLSRRGFDRAWGHAIASTGSSWGRGGRPGQDRKNHRTEIHAPEFPALNRDGY